VRHVAVLAAIGLILAVLFAGARHAGASITFYEGSGTGDSASGEGRYEEDLFQAAVSLPLATIDFEAFSSGSTVDKLTVGSLEIDVRTLNKDGAVGEESLRIFKGSYGSQPSGTVNGKALLAGHLEDEPQLEFLLSDPAQGFGLWVFDNAIGEANKFRMGVKEIGESDYIFWVFARICG